MSWQDCWRIFWGSRLKGKRHRLKLFSKPFLGVHEKVWGQDKRNCPPWWWKQVKSFSLSLFKKNCFIFNWRIIALQHCIGFCNPSTRIRHRYTYVLSLSNLLSHPPPLGCHKASGLGSMRHRTNPHWLCILHMIICMFLASLVAQWSRIHLQWSSHRRCSFDPWVGKIPWRKA